MRLDLRLPLIFAFFVLSHSAKAFKLVPMVVEFRPVGDESSQTFTLENPDQKKVAVEIKVTTRAHDESGNETRSPSTDFQVYPSQIVLDAGETRSVRVTYVGSKDLNRERAYRLIAKQQPITFKDERAQRSKNAVDLKFLVEYVASLYVGVPNSEPKIKTDRVEATKGQIQMHVLNEGSRHALLAAAEIRLIQSGKTIVLTAVEKKSLGTVNLLAGERRKVSFPKPKALTGAPFEVVIKPGNQM